MPRSAPIAILIDDAQWLDETTARLLGTAATALGDIEHSATLSARASDGLRRQGRLALLARALVSESWAGIHNGSWDLSLVTIDEGRRLAHETAQPRWVGSADLIESIILGQRGNAQRANELCARVEAAVLPTGAKAMTSLIELARGSSNLSAGRHIEALGHLGRTFDIADTAFHPILRCWALVDFVEAAVQADRAQHAAGVLDDMRKLADTTQSPLARVFVACATPLLADYRSSETRYQTALAQLGRWPFLRARTQLNYGTWLRRQRRSVDARTPLRAARETFDALRAQAWSERASRELRATGESGRRHIDTRDNSLTLKNSKSHRWQPTGSPTARSVNAFSSPTARSALTSTGSSPSWTSPLATSFATRYPIPTHHEQSRPGRNRHKRPRAESTPSPPITAPRSFSAHSGPLARRGRTAPLSPLRHSRPSCCFPAESRSLAPTTARLARVGLRWRLETVPFFGSAPKTSGSLDAARSPLLTQTLRGHSLIGIAEGRFTRNALAGGLAFADDQRATAGSSSDPSLALQPHHGATSNSAVTGRRWRVTTAR